MAIFDISLLFFWAVLPILKDEKSWGKFQPFRQKKPQFLRQLFWNIVECELYKLPYLESHLGRREEMFWKDDFCFTRKIPVSFRYLDVDFIYHHDFMVLWIENLTQC